MNDEVFSDEDEKLKACLKSVMDKGIPVVLVHEQDSEKNRCSLDNCIDQTPVELTQDPYMLFDKAGVAISLYSADYYRVVSLRQLMVRMGAEPTKVKLNFSTLKRYVERMSLAQSDGRYQSLGRNATPNTAN